MILPAVLLGLAALPSPQARPVPLDSTWELSGEGTRIEPYRRVRALRVRTGAAVRRDVSFVDGTIEFDMEVTRNRSFVYLWFRMQDVGEHEEIYFRPHKSSLPDAIQYTPVWRGDSNWQLYHGKGATAAVPLVAGEWMHVRLVVSGRRAALFLDDQKSPSLVMALSREPRPGHIGLRAFTPEGGAPAGQTVAAFANVVLRPGVVPYDFGPEPAPRAPEPGLITRWQVSPPFVPPAGPVTRLPDSLLAAKASWPSFPVEPNGVLVIGRHLARPAARSAAIARLMLRSDAERSQRLYLGYSDQVTVYLNGRPLFGGDARYSFDEPRQEGLIGRSQATIWLPLEQGDNEVLLAVADGFGGWGLIGLLDPLDGAQLVPPSP